MRHFFLLFLSLITGCEARSVMKGCTGGWVEFTCKYPKNNEKYQKIYVIRASHAQSTQKDVWENIGRFSLYHDTIYKTLRVIVKQLKIKDFGVYQCKFDQSYSPSSMSLQLLDDGSCQRPFTQTAYRTAKTTITCDYNPNDSRLKFFCKEIGSVCEDILSTKSSLKSNGTFNLTETNRGFNVSISNVSSQHTGVYWCGAKSNEGSYRYALKKIQLEVKDITTFKRSPTTGQNFSYWCAYQSDVKNNDKFICKGEDPSTCDPLVNTKQHTMKTGKFSMMEEKEKKITITIRDITTEDTGTYWCGAESDDEGHSNTFFNRFVMTVTQPTTPTFPVSSTQSTTAYAPPSHAGAYIVITVITCVSVLLLLLFGLILIFIYKRHLKSRAAAQHSREEYIYEEIQERPQKPDSGTAVNTIYVTAELPTNPSASLHYSTISYQNCSDNGEALIKSGSSACEYSTVKDSQRPIYSTVTQPSPEDPLYSTVSKPQEE